jgi:hypothetical protein
MSNGFYSSKNDKVWETSMCVPLILGIVFFLGLITLLFWLFGMID